MSLISRISLKATDEAAAEEAEDFLSSAIDVVFPDDTVNHHGDADHSVEYVSPHLPKPLLFTLADPTGEADRRLFSHYLWNSGLLAAELIEVDSLDVPDSYGLVGGKETNQHQFHGNAGFNVQGLSFIEVGAGTGLPSIMASLVGAARVASTDYPSPALLKTLRENISRNIEAQNAPDPSLSTPASSVVVSGHAWGVFSDEFSSKEAHAFDRVLAADCVWMPWQHDNLRKTISHFLGLDAGARAWVIAPYHTGREKAMRFFDKSALAELGLEVEHMWERDCNGAEREGTWDRVDDFGDRKFWICVCVLRRIIST
jgi:predicted nicotinamide N-methyase